MANEKKTFPVVVVTGTVMLGDAQLKPGDVVKLSEPQYAELQYLLERGILADDKGQGQPAVPTGAVTVEAESIDGGPSVTVVSESPPNDGAPAAILATEG